MVAVTGTNGKTSTTDFIRQMWSLQGHKAAGIGTLGLTGAEGTGVAFPPLTTPDPVALANGLAALERAGVHYAALEASSHGLEQRRLDRLRLPAAGLTTPTPQHLAHHRPTQPHRTPHPRPFATLSPHGCLAAPNACR